MNCPLCVSLTIDGVFTHEIGCYNRNAKYEADEWVHYFQCRECGDDVRKGENCNCTEPAEDETETPFVSMTFGTMPTKEEFLCAFYMLVGTSVYHIKNSPYFENHAIQSGEYSAQELYNEVNRCANLYNDENDGTEYAQKQAEEAGLMASCILQTLRFEWV
jgi:hypothetical protein